MEQEEFDFSAAFNSYEDSIAQITLKYIEETKAQNLSHYDMTSFMTHKANELEADLFGELIKFTNLCIESTRDSITMDSVVLTSYIIGLHTPKLHRLMAMYDHEADVILRRFTS